MTEKKTYVSAEVEVILFDNSDVITTSGAGGGGGGGGGGGCASWSNQNGVSCHYGLTAVY